jgi:regulator of protease activity HflC (stomatin/prohibitin superfamily)
MSQPIERRGVLRIPGLLALVGLLAYAGAICAAMIVGVGMANVQPLAGVFAVGVGGVGSVFGLFLLRGLTILEPNQAAVCLFFGKYSGTLDRDGFHYINPLLSARKANLRMQTFESPHLKVNEKGGRPIEIGAVVTWAVTEPETALLSVDDYATYLRNRTEVVLREVAASHPYEAEDGADCLRGNTTTVSGELKSRLAPMAAKAGLSIEDIMITQLAYAPEIAGSMLIKQQAESLLAARRVIVEGAVQIAGEAIAQLQAQGHTLSEAERGRALVNLLTVLASDRGTQPTVNVGN